MSARSNSGVRAVVIGRDVPAPIVDHDEGAGATLERYAVSQARRCAVT
jgi:hypothetical protein